MKTIVSQIRIHKKGSKASRVQHEAFAFAGVSVPTSYEALFGGLTAGFFSL